MLDEQIDDRTDPTVRKYRKVRPRSQAELACNLQEEQEYYNLCHDKVLYQLSGRAAQDYRDRVAATKAFRMERSTSL